MSNKLKEAFMQKGYEFFVESNTNLQHVILNGDERERLSQISAFHIVSQLDDNKYIARFVTSWATKESEIDAFIQQL